MDINKLTTKIVWEEIEASYVVVLSTPFQVEAIPFWDEPSVETLASLVVAYANKVGLASGATGVILINPRHPVA